VGFFTSLAFAVQVSNWWSHVRLMQLSFAFAAGEPFLTSPCLSTADFQHRLVHAMYLSPHCRLVRASALSLPLGNTVGASISAMPAVKWGRNAIDLDMGPPVSQRPFGG
jgi:hypothetical protein